MHAPKRMGRLAVHALFMRVLVPHLDKCTLADGAVRNGGYGIYVASPRCHGKNGEKNGKFIRDAGSWC